MDIILRQEDIDRIGLSRIMSLFEGTQVEFKGSADQVLETSPSLQYHPKESRQEEFNRKYNSVAASGKYNPTQLERFRKYYTSPSKDNPTKTVLDDMKYWDFDKRLDAWMSRIK